MQELSLLRKDLGNSQGDGNVDIVPAGMMNTGILRFEECGITVLARKRIKLGSPCNRLSRVRASQYADDTVAVLTSLNFKPHFTQVRADCR